MAYDEELAHRVRAVLADRDVTAVERQMFGGLAFMVGGHMTVGILGDELMARVGADAYEEALAQPNAREMDFTGRTMRGFVIVGPEGVAGDGALGEWVQRAIHFTGTLPPK